LVSKEIKIAEELNSSNQRHNSEGILEDFLVMDLFEINHKQKFRDRKDCQFPDFSPLFSSSCD
jgi:hypothetical protein